MKIKMMTDPPDILRGPHGIAVPRGALIADAPGNAKAAIMFWLVSAFGHLRLQIIETDPRTQAEDWFERISRTRVEPLGPENPTVPRLGEIYDAIQAVAEQDHNFPKWHHMRKAIQQARSATFRRIVRERERRSLTVSRQLEAATKEGEVERGRLAAAKARAIREALKSRVSPRGGLGEEIAKILEGVRGCDDGS